MTEARKEHNEEHWEALAMLLAETLRRLLGVPKPESQTEDHVDRESIHALPNHSETEVTSC